MVNNKDYDKFVRVPTLIFLLLLLCIQMFDIAKNKEKCKIKYKNIQYREETINIHIKLEGKNMFAFYINGLLI